MSDDEDVITVEVEQVFDNGTTAIGIGHDTTTGELIRFGGDWRPMSVLAEAVVMDGSATAEVPLWAILSRS